MKYDEVSVFFDKKSIGHLAEVSVNHLEKSVPDHMFFETDRAYKEIYSADIIQLNADTIESPATPWGAPAEIFSSDVNSKGELRTNGLYAIHLKNIRLLADPGLLIYADQYILKEYLGKPFHHRAMHWLKRKREFRWGRIEATRNIHKQAEEYGNGIDFSTDFGDRNVFHWIARVLPKTKLLESLPNDWPLVFSYEPNDFQKESLKALDISNPLLIIDPKKPATFKSYVVIEGSWALYNRNMIHDLRQRLINDQADSTSLNMSGMSDNPASSKKLFVYREDDWTRKLINRRDVMNHLSAHGYSHNSLKGVGLRDTIKLFSEADEIIFEHGAAGVFLLFTKSDAKIIEIIPSRVHESSKETTNFFFWASKILNRTFGYIVCENKKCSPWPEFELEIESLKKIMCELNCSKK